VTRKKSKTCSEPLVRNAKRKLCFRLVLLVRKKILLWRRWILIGQIKRRRMC